jgi:polysaccharide deacetylase family protein (PEP-CTERM system associated)
MLNALTIDVEDYYHVTGFESVIQRADWDGYESRVERNTLRLLDLLDTHHTRATFFVLGWVAERHPQLVRTIHALGHEVASHGYAHQRIYTQTPEQFREETHRSKQILEDVISRPVLGYRAASYSITQQSLWALEILREEGFVYDSSIFPIHHDRYGIPGYSRFCHRVDGRAGAGLVEFPPSTVQLGGVNIPIAGGGYFRIYPYAFTRWGIRHINAREHQPAVVYLHPWEIDPEQPRIPTKALSRFRQYFNLAQTATRLTRLLQDFTFGTMASVLSERGLLKTPVNNSMAREMGR